MTDQPGEGIHIDSDWKEEARQEKERLTQTEAAARPTAVPEPSFAELVNLIVMQAAMALGGFKGPKGEQIPPDLSAARHYVDLLGLLERKTADNLTEDEKRILEHTLYELRMQFVEAAGAPATPKSPPADEPKIETP